MQDGSCAGCGGPRRTTLSCRWGYSKRCARSTYKRSMAPGPLLGCRFRTQFRCGLRVKLFWSNRRFHNNLRIWTGNVSKTNRFPVIGKAPILRYLPVRDSGPRPLYRILLSAPPEIGTFRARRWQVKLTGTSMRMRCCCFSWRHSARGDLTLQ